MQSYRKRQTENTDVDRQLQKLDRQLQRQTVTEIERQLQKLDRQLQRKTVTEIDRQLHKLEKQLHNSQRNRQTIKEKTDSSRYRQGVTNF